MRSVWLCALIKRNFNMFNLPTSEFNPAPSAATFNLSENKGVVSRLSAEEIKSMPTNGHSLDSLREFSSLNRHDDIDRVGMATKMLTETASTYSKSGFARQLFKQIQTSKKPLSK